jgi:hypothetical protein
MELYSGVGKPLFTEISSGPAPDILAPRSSVIKRIRWDGEILLPYVMDKLPYKITY